MPVTNALKRLMQKTRSLSYCIGLVMVVLFVYGLIRYPDLPIRECPSGYCGRQGQPQHSGRIQRLQHMADDAIYRLAHRDAYNASFAARKTQKVKGGSNRPRSCVKLSAMHRGATPLIAGYVARHKTLRQLLACEIEQMLLSRK